MATRENPPRPWKIDDLQGLARQGNAYLKAVPVLILEKWVREERREGVANVVTTKELAERLVGRGLVPPFEPKGSAQIFRVLTTMQNFRNLTDPPLVEKRRSGEFLIKLPHYEGLLEKYRQKYRQDYPDDYQRLFQDGEPPWVPLPEPPEILDVPKPLGILQVLEKHDRDWQKRLQDADNRARDLEEENQKLKAELDAFKAPKRMIVDEELRNDCAEFLEREDTYVDAIRRAGVVLEERLKKAIGGDGPEKFKQGVDLVDYALRKDSGQLIVSEHPAEQEGIHMLFRGAVQFVRNPPSHKKMRYTEVEAAQAIGLIDYLLLLLRQVRRR